MVSYLCSAIYAEETHLLAVLKSDDFSHALTILTTQIDTLTKKAQQEGATKEALQSRIAAYVNQQDSEKRTALHYAANVHDVDLVEALLNAGNNYVVADVYNKTPLDYAHKLLKCFVVSLVHKKNKHVQPTTQQLKKAFKVLTLLSQAYNQVIEKKDKLLRSYQESAGIQQKQASSTCDLL